MMPAAILSLLVKTEGAAAAEAQLRRLDSTGRRAGATVTSLGRESRKSGTAMRTIGHGAAYALGAGGFGGGMYALFDITKKSIKEFREAQTVTRQTGAALKSTGGAAGVTAKEIANLANSIKRKTAIDDETIQSGENMLLTFTKIRNEAGKGNNIFDQATQAITDMSVAMNRGATPSAEQLSKTAILVGKALNDPIKGATALRRVGVDLDKQTQDQIKTLIAHGHRLQAQKIILRELTTEFGGSAAAQATSAKRLQVTLGDLAEKIGGALAPVIEKVTRKISIFVDQMLDGTGAGGRFVSTMKNVWDSLQPLIGALKTTVKFLAQHPALLKAAAAAWVAYKTAALIQLAITKAAMLGLFGAGTRARLAAEAGKTGTVAGRGFAAKAGLAAAAGIAGWEIGTWIRNHSKPVRDAGDWLARQFSKGWIDVVDNTAAETVKRLGRMPGIGLPSKPTFPKLPSGLKPKAPKTGRGQGGPQGTGRVSAKTSSVVARASSVATRIKAKASGSGSNDIAGTIIAVGRAMGATDKQILAALEAGIVESGLQNLSYGDRDSVGVFQQRPSQGWTGLMNVPKAAQEFFAAAKKVGGKGMTAGQLAQAVQRSAYPGRYDQVEGRARSILGGGTPARGGGGGKAPIDPAVERRKALARAQALAKKRSRELAAAKKREREGWAKVKATLARGAAARKVDTTLSNPWLTAYLGHQDYLVASGALTQAQGNANKTMALQNALPQLPERDKTTALGLISDMAPTVAAVGDAVTNEGARLSHIQNQVRAGDLTSEQGRQAEIASIQDALDNWILTDDERLQLRGDLRELTMATTDNTDAVKAQADALNALKDEVKRQTDFATSVANTESAAMAKWVTEVISKQMGFGISGRALTPAFGVERRT